MADHSAEPGIQKRVVLQVRVEGGSEPQGTGATHAMNWVFPGDTLCVGRSKDEAQLAVESDSAMSKRHFQVSYDGVTCQLTDLNSTNGTMVNGQRVTTDLEIADGDEICAGTTIFTVGIMGGDDGSVDEPAPPGSATTIEIPVPAEVPRTETKEARPEAPEEFRDTAAAPLPKVVTLRLQTESSAVDPSGGLSRLLAWIRAGQCISVGSSSYHADWAVPSDTGVAPLHFQISFDGNKCALQNLDSEKHTLVNGQPVNFGSVKDGDIITAGATNFLVQVS